MFSARDRSRRPYAHFSDPLTMMGSSFQDDPVRGTVLKKATFYEKVAEHESAPWVQRVEFARKANTFRILARLAAMQEEVTASRPAVKKQPPQIAA